MSRPSPLSNEVRAFIEAQRVAHLATVDRDGRPHIVPICFCLLGDNLYTPVDEKPKSTAPSKLKRVKNIAANAHVQVVFDVYEDGDWTKLRYAQLRGSAALAVDTGERTTAIARLRHRYSQYEHMSLEDRPLIRIEIEHVVDWRGAH